MKLIENGLTNAALEALVRMQGMEIDTHRDPRVLNALLQEKWVKAKEGVFRAQLGGRFPTEEEMALLRQLGADAIPIDFNVEYGGTLLLGATLKAVARRTTFLVSEWDRESEFPPLPLYLLGSGRLLDVNQEMPEHVPTILRETGACWGNWDDDARAGRWPKNEITMMERVLFWQFINDWENVSVWASDRSNPDGSTRPANTAETVKAWLTQAQPGHYLIVSSQPFCENQKMAVERAVKEAGVGGYSFDVCGPEAPPLPLSRWLDNLAKQLWEEVQLL